LTKAVSTILQHAYRSKSESQKNGSWTKTKRSRGGHSHELDTIQEHKAALMLYGYKIVEPMKNVMSLPLAINWGWSSAPCSIVISPVRRITCTRNSSSRS
jgi:hypothetical protein